MNNLRAHANHLNQNISTTGNCTRRSETLKNAEKIPLKFSIQSKDLPFFVSCHPTFLVFADFLFEEVGFSL